MLWLQPAQFVTLAMQFVDEQTLLGQPIHAQ